MTFRSADRADSKGMIWLVEGKKEFLADADRKRISFKGMLSRINYVENVRQAGQWQEQSSELEEYIIILELFHCGAMSHNPNKPVQTYVWT